MKETIRRWMTWALRNPGLAFFTLAGPVLYVALTLFLAEGLPLSEAEVEAKSAAYRASLLIGGIAWMFSTAILVVLVSVTLADEWKLSIKPMLKRWADEIDPDTQGDD